MKPRQSTLPFLDASRVATIEAFGGTITPLDPLGAQVQGIDLSSGDAPPPDILEALECEMANRGFLVFKNETPLSADDFLRASCWWGGKALHSTHGVHPATPGGNRHIFRLSNDQRHGIPGVGPQWHNDGSFNADTFAVCRTWRRGSGCRSTSIFKGPIRWVKGSGKAVVSASDGKMTFPCETERRASGRNRPGAPHRPAKGRPAHYLDLGAGHPSAQLCRRGSSPVRHRGGGRSRS